MLQVTKIIPQGRGLARSLVNRAATIELDWDVRQKSRFECTDSQGRQLGVFLPRGTVARGRVAPLRAAATCWSATTARWCA
jgi:urease accessory protein